MSKRIVKGSTGGFARAAKLTKEQRSAIAKAAAQKRWGKDKEDAPVIPKEVADGVNVIAEGIRESLAEAISLAESPESKDKHCPACAMGQSLQKGEGTHVLATVEHQYDPGPSLVVQSSPIQNSIVPQVQKKAKRKSMPKDFQKASNYAEKRLAEALKERAEYMGRVAALNAEIPSLVQVIKALGTSTIPPEAMQAYPFTSMNYPSVPQAPNYPVEPILPNNIDPALFATNSNPLPGLVPAAAQAPVVPNTAMGGAADLDYVPREDEPQRLPNMGNGWV
jgi:hypothetical protein